MASTFVDFVPSTSTAFQFQPTLNGVQYNATVYWNVFGQRYYISIVDLSGNPIVYTALNGTGPQISSQFSWANGIATVTTLTPHNVPVGIVAITDVQTGTGFDGMANCLSTGPNTLTYLLSTDPDEPTPLTGFVSFDLNIVGGFNIGSLLFHEDTNQFEF